MSHIHSLLAQSAAAQQLENLERMRAAKLAEDARAVRGRATVRTFDSLIDADGEADDTPDRETPDEPEDEGGKASAEDGFGTRYA